MVWLVAKEWRDLTTSRVWWLMLALVGPLVGLSFIDAVHAFAEISTGAGTACGAVCAPLLGVWGPTFSAYEVLAIFVLPFVAIKLVSGDRQSGALKLELQQAVSPLVRIGVKGLVLLAGWCVTLAAAAVAAGLWTFYGGHLYAPEMGVALLGHFLNAGLTVALAIAVASMADHPSTAAIVTLAITIGTWVLDLAAAIHGGIWDQFAKYTPAAMVATFQRGLLQADIVAIVLVITLAGFAMAAVWIRLGVFVRRRVLETVVIVVVAAMAIVGASRIPGTWDISESRQNSFSIASEEWLAKVTLPIVVEVHLAPQDPRRWQLDRGALGKLRRALPNLQVRYVSRSTTGLYEQHDDDYGALRFTTGDRQNTSRVLTDDGVLEGLFALVGLEWEEEADGSYHGYPLTAQPVGAAWIYYALWPLAVAGLGIRAIRRTS